VQGGKFFEQKSTVSLGSNHGVVAQPAVSLF
jgi:hypothetical protein